jgi:hypothetical protein
MISMILESTRRPATGCNLEADCPAVDAAGNGRRAARSSAAVRGCRERGAGGQPIASRLRGAAPDSVTAMPQSVKPVAR